MSEDAAVVAVLSQPDGIFTLKEEPKMLLKTFLTGQHCLALLPTGVFAASHAAAKRR